jgi:hypothetical protein
MSSYEIPDKDINPLGCCAHASRVSELEGEVKACGLDGIGGSLPDRPDDAVDGTEKVGAFLASRAVVHGMVDGRDQAVDGRVDGPTQ